MDGPDAERRNLDRTSSRDDRPGSAIQPSDVGDDDDRKAEIRPRDVGGDAVEIDGGIGRWVLESDERTVAVCRSVGTALVVFAFVSVLLFGISGQFPVLVAVESGSMEPNLRTGDIVFVVEEGRYAGGGAVDGTGVVTLDRGREAGHRTFDGAGDVIIFLPDGDPTKTPVIHRAHFWVEAGENWVETKADPESTKGATCTDIPSCPASHDGFVTKGDANGAYDQLPRYGAETTVVRPSWVTGKAMVRVPWLGRIRLAIGSIRTAAGIGSVAMVGASGAIALVLFAMAAGADRGGS